MNENEMRYILRMMNAFKDNCMFLDSTQGDITLIDQMEKAYHVGGRWQSGSEAAFIHLVKHVQENGIPGGDYLNSMGNILQWQPQRGTPIIERDANEQSNPT